MCDGGFRNSDLLLALSLLCLEKHYGCPLKRLRNESSKSGKEREKETSINSRMLVFLGQLVELPKQQTVLCSYTHEFLCGGVNSLFV